MTKTEVDLPEWAAELVLRCESSHNFMPLAEVLCGYHVERLSKDQLGYLYKLAEPALIRKAHIWWFYVRATRTEPANRLRRLITNAEQHGGIDLQQRLQSAPEFSMDMVEYMCRVRELKRAYVMAQEGGRKRDEKLLADNLLGPMPVEAWEYDAEEAKVLELARQGKLDTMLDYVSRCRNGGTAYAEDILKAVKALRFDWSELGTSQAEVKGWARQEIIRNAKRKLRFGLDNRDDVLYANIWGALKQMLGHNISPEELGTTKAELRQAKQRLERWLQQVLSECRGRTYQAERRNYREFRDTVFPMFDKVLNQD